MLPFPRPRIPTILAEGARRVDHRQTLRARNRQQRLQGLDAVPSRIAAGIAPPFDRLQDRLAPVAAEIVADIDDEHGRTFAESLTRSIAAGREDGLVLLS